MKKQLIIGTMAAILLGGTALAQQTGQPAGKAPAQQTQTNKSGTTSNTSSDMTKSGTSAATPSTAASSSTSSGTAPAATTGAANATDMTKGFAMSGTASAAVQYGNADTGNLMTSKLIGTDVYNNEKEKIGEITDLAIENGKTLTGVVVSVGGFLGMGESYVLIEPSSIALNREDGEWRAHVNTNKDALKNAPKFTYKDVEKKS